MCFYDLVCGEQWATDNTEKLCIFLYYTADGRSFSKVNIQVKMNIQIITGN